MELDLFTNTTVVDDAIRFVSSKSKETLKSSTDGNKEESREPDYDEDEDQLEEEQEEETGETAVNQVFWSNDSKSHFLIIALRTAVDNDGVLDKEATSYNDIFDAFRLALKFYSFRDSHNTD